MWCVGLCQVIARQRNPSLHGTVSGFILNGFMLLCHQTWNDFSPSKTRLHLTSGTIGILECGYVSYGHLPIPEVLGVSHLHYKGSSLHSLALLLSLRRSSLTCEKRHEGTKESVTNMSRAYATLLQTRCQTIILGVQRMERKTIECGWTWCLGSFITVLQVLLALFLVVSFYFFFQNLPWHYTFLSLLQWKSRPFPRQCKCFVNSHMCLCIPQRLASE